MRPCHHAYCMAYYRLIHWHGRVCARLDAGKRMIYPFRHGIIFSELLEPEGLTPKQAQYVRAIRDSGAALLHLINDILDLSKLEAGKMGGTLVVESKVGQGTLFRLRFPNVRVSGRLPVGDHAQPGGAVDFNHFAPATLLVVDDNQTNSARPEGALRSAGDLCRHAHHLCRRLRHRPNGKSPRRISQPDRVHRNRLGPGPTATGMRRCRMLAEQISK